MAKVRSQRPDQKSHIKRPESPLRKKVKPDAFAASVGRALRRAAKAVSLKP